MIFVQQILRQLYQKSLSVTIAVKKEMEVFFIKKELFNNWCKTAWLKCGLLISALMIVLILVNWNSWSTALKCIAAVAALIPVHATEEWIFPGGFAYQYNLFLNSSDYPKAYPMNRASDMITVLGTTVMYALLVLYFAVTETPVPSGVLLGATGFSVLEVSVHTYFGIRAYGKFKNKGKTTIYGTGSVSAYTCFLPLGCIMIWQITVQKFSVTDLGWCVAVLGIISVLVFVPEAKLKDTNSPYAYQNSGYYERFL